MTFITKVPDIDSLVKIHHTSPVFLMGSCFSEVFGKKLTATKFSCLYNPFGTIYNPVSMAKIMNYVVKEKVPDQKSIYQQNGVWHHFDFHGDMNALDANEVVANLEKNILLTRHFLQKARLVMITPGTSVVYERRDTGEIVANCHKVPASFFQKRMLSVEEVYIAVCEMIENIKSLQQNIKFVLTLSPVRHIRDGLTENNLSKARLLEAIHRVMEKHPEVMYFPSYEIVLDELRDYRFFEKDMIHPNQLAHEVLWEYFCRNMMTDESRNIVIRVEKLISAKNHRPQFPTHPDYIQFCKRQSEEIALLENILPQSDFGTEKSFFRQYI